MYTVNPYKKRFVKCPNGCKNQEFSVEHMYELNMKKAGPWYCEECFQGWYFETSGEEIILTADATNTKDRDGRCYPSHVFLEIPPQEKSIYLKIKGMYWHKDNVESHNEYFYEEHTCPVNYFRDVEEIWLGVEGEDPHGLAKYVTAYPREINTTDINSYVMPDHVKQLLKRK
jgi:hypothetical protein